jgi:hypothetical protein
MASYKQEKVMEQNASALHVVSIVGTINMKN